MGDYLLLSLRGADPLAALRNVPARLLCSPPVRAHAVLLVLPRRGRQGSSDFALPRARAWDLTAFP